MIIWKIHSDVGVRRIVVKLAFALFTYFPHGGLTRDLIAIARACRQRGHGVQVYAAERRGATDGEIEVRLLPPKARTNHGKTREFSVALQRALLTSPADLLVGFNKMPRLDVYYGADGCFAAKSRQRGLLYRMTPRCRHYLNFEEAVFSPRSTSEILLLAKSQLRLYRDCYATPRERMHLLPPGIHRDRIAGDDAQARRAIFRERWQLGEDDKLLLAVGSGFRTKGLERTLRAFANLPAHSFAGARLFVVGDDNAAPFEKLARRLGIRSRVHFVQGRDDVPEFLLGADLLVHPAHRENTGTVLLEAMVAGLPVITTDVCGYAHYVADEAMGEVLASPFEQVALNRALPRLLAVQRDVWRSRGRDFAERADIYDMPLHACRHLEAIAERRRQSRSGEATP